MHDSNNLDFGGVKGIKVGLFPHAERVKTQTFRAQNLATSWNHESLSPAVNGLSLMGPGSKTVEMLIKLAQN